MNWAMQCETEGVESLLEDIWICEFCGLPWIKARQHRGHKPKRNATAFLLSGILALELYNH